MYTLETRKGTPSTPQVETPAKPEGKSRTDIAERTRERRLQSMRKFEEQRKAKKEELDSSRYSDFRHEFEDIFEATLSRRPKSEEK
jgi:hypothetical protein